MCIPRYAYLPAATRGCCEDETCRRTTCTPLISMVLERSGSRDICRVVCARARTGTLDSLLLGAFGPPRCKRCDDTPSIMHKLRFAGCSLTLFSLLLSTRHHGSTFQRATTVFGFFALGRLGLARGFFNHALGSLVLDGSMLLFLAIRTVQGNADNHGIRNALGDVSLITNFNHQVTLCAGKIANRKILPRTQAGQTKRVHWTVLRNCHLIHFGLRIHVDALGFIVLQVI